MPPVITEGCRALSLQIHTKAISVLAVGPHPNRLFKYNTFFSEVFFISRVVASKFKGVLVRWYLDPELKFTYLIWSCAFSCVQYKGISPSLTIAQAPHRGGGNLGLSDVTRVG